MRLPEQYILNKLCIKPSGYAINILTSACSSTAHVLSIFVQLVPRYNRTKMAITCTATEAGVRPNKEAGVKMVTDDLIRARDIPLAVREAAEQQIKHYTVAKILGQSL